MLTKQSKTSKTEPSKITKTEQSKTILAGKQNKANTSKTLQVKSDQQTTQQLAKAKMTQIVRQPLESEQEQEQK